jgi:hypothetical protein
MSDTIAAVPFVATLGDDTCTTLELRDVVWNTTVVTDSVIPGMFCASGVCYVDGTPRLLVSGTISEITSISPNPARDNIVVAYTTGETGLANLEIIDILGVRHFGNSAWHQRGSYNAHVKVSDIPQGRYTVLLRTATTTRSATLIIE